jgi:hypothetical protein
MQGMLLEAERTMAKHPSDYLTIPGRILAFISLLLAAGGFWANIAWVWEDLSPGSYSLLFFAMPAMVAAAFLFFLGAAVLKRLGVAVFKKPDES